MFCALWAFLSSFEHLGMLLVCLGATMGHFLLNMVMPSAVFGSLLAYLWASLGFLREAVGHILHTLDHFGVTWRHF